jgi:hypothetical protein
MHREGRAFPRNIWTIPKGKIAVHNNIAHHRAQRSGESGFRVWFDDLHENYVECSSGWRPDLKTRSGRHQQAPANP